jgi:hypothetical protein
VESCPPLPFLKIYVGRKERLKFIEVYFEGSLSVLGKGTNAPKAPFLDGPSSEKAVAEQNEEMPQGKLGVFRSEEEGSHYYRRRDFLEVLKRRVEEHLRLVEEKLPIWSNALRR